MECIMASAQAEYDAAHVDDASRLREPAQSDSSAGARGVASVAPPLQLTAAAIEAPLHIACAWSSFSPPVETAHAEATLSGRDSDTRLCAPFFKMPCSNIVARCAEDSSSAPATAAPKADETESCCVTARASLPPTSTEAKRACASSTNSPSAYNPRDKSCSRAWVWKAACAA